MPRTVLSSSVLLLLQCLIFTSFAQLQFPTSYVTIPRGDLTFYFNFDDARSYVRMGLEINKNVDYFAVGFAPEGHYGMTEFDIVAFVFPNNNAAPTVMDLYSYEFGRPPTDVSLGGTADYVLLDSYVTDGKRQVLFERKYDTGDRFDYVLDPTVTKEGQVMNWAYHSAGTGEFAYHEENAGTIYTYLYNGYTGVATDYLPSSPTKVLLSLHGYLMLIGWGLLIEIAIQIGRYRKHDTHFIAVHVILNATLYVITIVLTAFALYVKWGDTSGFLSLIHLYTGLLIVILVTAQVILGAILRRKVISYQDTNQVPRLNIVHLTMGAIVYFVTKFQIGLGLYLFRPNYMGYLYLYYLVVFTFRIAQEYSYIKWQRLGGLKSFKPIQGPDSKLDRHRKLMKLLNNNTPVHQIKQNAEVKDLKWAILDDKVFETEGFNHPGGNFIKNYIQGREIGRFSYGAYPLELYPESGEHKHSTEKLLIIEQHLIGTIENGHHVLIPRGVTGEEEAPLVERGSLKSRLLEAGVEKGAGKWTLAKKTPITDYITKFEFSSKDFSINGATEDLRYIGRHMKVSHVKTNKTRLYTLVLCQTEARIQRRNYLWNKAYNESDIMGSGETDYRSETIPFIIKRYDIPNQDTFSSFVHNSNSNTEGFIIEGPYGTGLGLSRQSTGLHYIFAVGTGIWPFLDLFDYLLDELLDSNSIKELFKNGFKLHVFVGFAKLEDFAGLDICEKLLQACKENGLEDAFKMTIRAKGAQSNGLYEVSEQSFDEDFIKNNVNAQCERVMVCGSPSFNYKIPLALEALGIPRDKINLV